MDNSIKAYDLGYSNLVEACQRISVNELVCRATKDLKKHLVEAQIEALGIHITLTTSRTRFNGERLWFICPGCKRKVGTVFEKKGTIGCRKCLKLIYKNQRYKEMVEI